MDDEAGTKLCSNCQQEISKTVFVMHELHCRRNIVLCPVCKEPVRKAELEQHHEEEHAPKPCDLCGTAIPAGQLENHKENDCPKFKVECKYCELEFHRADLSEHVEGCGSRTDYCELCNRRVMLKDMVEHKENKCAVAMGDDIVDDTIDITSYGGQNQRSDPFFSQQLLFGSGTGFPFHQPVHLSPGHSAPPPFFPFPFGHANQVPPVPTFEAPPPVRKQPREEEREESFQVDPQWLASVADVCGEENLDQVLAQNMMIQGSYSAAAPRPDSRQGHTHGSGHRHSSTESSGTHASDEDLARQLQEELNRQQQFDTNDESYVRPKTPEFIKTLNTYSYGASDSVHRDADDAMAQGRNGSSSGEEDMEQKDAEMARRIYERDLAYAQRNQGASNGDVGELGGGVDPHGLNPASLTTEDSDAKMARRIYERDLAYAQRNQGNVDQLGGEVDPHGFGSAASNSTNDDTEMARRIYERDLAYAKRNQGIDPGSVDQLGSDVDPHGFSAAASSTAQSDAELAKVIYDRDLASARRNLGDGEHEASGTAVASSHAAREQSDAEFARMLQGRDFEYSQRNLGSNVDNVSSASREKSDAEYAKMLYEQDLKYFKGGADDARKFHEQDLTYTQRNKNHNSSTSRSQSYHQQDNDYNPKGAAASSSSRHSSSHERKPNGVSYGSPNNDARIAQALQEADMERVETINADKELAWKLQAQEQVSRDGSSYGRMSPTSYPRQAEDGWDQDMINLQNHDEEQIPARWKAGVVEHDEPLPKTPPTPKEENDQVIPCQYCKKLCSFQGLWDHEKRCSQTRESGSKVTESYRGNSSATENWSGPDHPSSAVLATSNDRVTFPSSVRPKETRREELLPLSAKHKEVERKSASRQEEISFPLQGSGLEKKSVKQFEASQRGRVGPERAFFKSSKPECDDSVYLTDDILKKISNHSNTHRTGYSHTSASNVGNGYSGGVGINVGSDFQAKEGSNVGHGYSGGVTRNAGTGHLAKEGSNVGHGYSGRVGSNVGTGHLAKEGSSVEHGYSGRVGSNVGGDHLGRAGSKVGSGHSAGVSEGMASGSGASLLSQVDDEKGPCMICGQPFPIKELVKHEAICLIRAQSKRTTTTRSEFSNPKTLSAPGSTKTATKQQGSKADFHFPSEDRTETSGYVTSGNRTHSPNRVSNGFARPTAKPAATKQSFGSSSSRNPSSSTTAYRSLHNDGTTRTGDKRLDSGSLRAVSSSKTAVGPKQSNAVSSKAAVSSSRTPQLGVEGVKIKNTSRPHPQYGRGEERKLDPPQYHPAHPKDNTRNRGAYQYSDQPKPINHASSRDRKL